MKTAALFLLISMIILTTGCPQPLVKTRPSEKLGKNELTTQVNTYLANRQMAYYCAMTGNHVNSNLSTFNPLAIYTCGSQRNTSGSTTDEDKLIAKRIRDETMENGIMAVNSVYTEFTDDLHTGRATTNFVADVIDIGLGAAIGISKGERALHILGISLTAFRSGRKSVDLNFFREQTIPILINKMDDNRSTVYGSMLMKKKLSADDYTMAEVVRDIVDYYNAGTLIRAFSQLSKDSGEKANESAKKVLQLKNADPSMVVAVPFDVVDAGNKFTAFVQNTNRILGSSSTTQEVKDRVTENLRLIYRDIFANEALKPKLAAFKTASPGLKANMDALEADEKTVSGKDILNILVNFYTSIKTVEADQKLIIDLKNSMEKYPLN